MQHKGVNTFFNTRLPAVWLKRRLIGIGSLAVLLAFIWSIGSAGASDSVRSGYIDLVQRLEVDRFGTSQPLDLTSDPLTGTLLFLERDKNSITSFSTFGKLLATNVSPAGSGRIEYDDRSGTLLTFDPQEQQLRSLPWQQETGVGAGGENPGTAVSLPTTHVNGIAVDPVTNVTYLLDGASEQLLRVGTAELKEPGRPPASPAPSISTINIGGSAAALRGLAFDLASRHLFSINSTDASLLEFTLTGELVKVYDLSPFNLPQPQALTFAPSTSQVDDPADASLYIAGGVQEGDIWEFTFTPPAPLSMAAETPTLVQEIIIWQFDPPSPDGSGVTYLPHSNRILETDSEVNEKPIYADVNQFEMDLDGTNVTNHDTTHFSDEPTGVAYDIDRNHLFFSDDDADMVWETDLSYNLVNSFSVATLDGKAVDAEGIAYNSWLGRLYIAGGTTDTIFWIHPGADNDFGTSDDVEGSFPATDLNDPEGITFDTDTGNIYGVARDNLVEYTPAGSQVRVFDISEPNPTKAAGLAFGPSSTGGGKSIYVSARGQDDDETINGGSGDGMIYEFTHESFGPTNSDPNTPSNPTPGDNSTDNSISSTLSWTGGDPDGDPVTYDLYLDTSNPPALLQSGLTAANFDPGPLDYDTTYYWQIIAHDNHSGTAVGPVWHFSTAVDPGSIVNQDIDMGPGWKMFSSYVLPQDTDFAVIFNPIDNDLLLIKNAAGDLFWPDLGMNNIVWDTCQGYKAYLTGGPVTSSIAGAQIIPENTECLLDSGWNLIAYLRDSAMSISTALATCSSETTLVKNGAGAIYWPAYGVDQIVDMIPGEGYELYLSASCTLIYPAN